MDIKRYFKYGMMLLTDYKRMFNFLSGLGLYKNMPDEKFVKKLYKANTGKTLNLENPQTFNEKLQWMKLYDRNPLYTVTSDKYAVREYIKNKIGEEHLVPLLGVWDSPDEIDFDSLPEQFVLKCNHNSGIGSCICRDKSKLDIEKVRKELRKGLNENYYLASREWQYKDIKRKIICEKFMSDGQTGSLLNYKIYCFSGEPKIFHISSDIGDEAARLSFLDVNWNPFPFCRTDYPPFEVLPEEPDNREELLETARILSQDFAFVRVDLYVVGGFIYFSELTLDPCGGFNPFSPDEWDLKLGEWLELPKQMRKDK